MLEDSAEGFGFRRGCCWGYLFVYENAPEKLSQLDLMVQGRAQLEHSSHIVKACVRYFLIKFLFFHQMRVLQNLWKIFFIPSKKLFSFSKYSNFCNFFPSFPHFPYSKWQMEVEQFTMSWIGFHKFTGENFGITQKPLYIISSNLVR